MKQFLKIGIVVITTFLVCNNGHSQEIDKQEDYLIKLLKKFKGTKREVIEKELFTYEEVKDIMKDVEDVNVDLNEEEYNLEIKRNTDRIIENASGFTINWSNIDAIDYKTTVLSEKGLDLVSGKLKFRSGTSDYRIKAMFVKYKGKYRLGELRSLYQSPEESEEEYEAVSVEEVEGTEEAAAEEVELAYAPEYNLTDSSFCDIQLGMHLDSPEIVAGLKRKLIDGVRKVNGKYINVKIILDDMDRHVGDVKLDPDGFVQEIRVYSKDVFLNRYQLLKYFFPSQLEYTFPEGEYITEGNKEFFKAGRLYFQLSFNMNNEPSEITEVLIRSY